MTCNYHDDDGNHGWCDWYDKFLEWHNGYQTQKAQIKEVLLPIAWHPSRYLDWCVPEDEKEEIGKLWR